MEEEEEPTAYDVAVELDAQGFCILPAVFKDKMPMVGWKKYQTHRSTDDLLELFGFDMPYNFWNLCGHQSGCVCLDCDNQAAIDFWEEKLGKDVLWKTARVKSRKGYHFYFRLPEGQRFESWAEQPDDPDLPHFDVQGDGKGVILPPSVHATGHVYAWEVPWSEALPVPEALYKSEVRTDAGIAAATGARTNLAELLGNPPQGEHGRNVWLTAVAGHYAKGTKFEDAYQEQVKLANKALGHPLSEKAVLKVANSIWGAEQSKPEEPSPENGWLIAGEGHTLMTKVRVKDDQGNSSYELQTWANFDIQASGVIRDEVGNRSWAVTILKEGEKPLKELLEPETIANPPKLNVWLAAKGCTVVPPVGDVRRGLKSERLQRYLESQKPPEYRGVRHLGWHRGIGFVVHEGIITPDGLLPHDTIMPHTVLRDWAPYRYGFTHSEDEVRAVLRELLTYHFPDVACVYASWLIANVLKGQDGFEAAHWPCMVIEAVSESGKTRGVFAPMNQLICGYTFGAGNISTMAATRDAASAHNNGLIWSDDAEDPTGLMELIRQATSGGSRSKKAMNRTSQETISFCNNFCVSGESLGPIMSEKAMRDRAIQLDVPSPVNRISKHGNYSQWNDISDLMNRYNRDLTCLAGTMVQMILREAAMCQEFRTLRGGGGRHQDKIGVLRVGARVLAKITGNPRVVKRVDAWCAAQQDLGAENTLTTFVIPQLLIGEGVPTSAVGAPAAFYKDDHIWVNAIKVENEWRRVTRMGERSRDLASEQSVRAQIKVLRDGEKSQTWAIDGQTHGKTVKQLRYNKLNQEISQKIMDRLGATLGEITTPTTVVMGKKRKSMDESRTSFEQVSWFGGVK